MTLRTFLAATALAAGLGLSGAAHAQIVASAVNICEVSGGQVNTIDLRFVSPLAFWEYRFQTRPSGPQFVFPSLPFSMALHRKVPLPAGSYKLTFKDPSQPQIGTYAPTVVVPPFRVSGQTCVVLKPADVAQKAPGTRRN